MRSDRTQTVTRRPSEEKKLYNYKQQALHCNLWIWWIFWISTVNLAWLCLFEIQSPPADCVTVCGWMLWGLGSFAMQIVFGRHQSQTHCTANCCILMPWFVTNCEQLCKVTRLWGDIVMASWSGTVNSGPTTAGCWWHHHLASLLSAHFIVRTFRMTVTLLLVSHLVFAAKHLKNLLLKDNVNVYRNEQLKVYYLFLRTTAQFF